MNCIICKNRISDNDNKTCETCIDYISKKMVCSPCNDIHTRTNRKRHTRPFVCISNNGELALCYKR